MNGGYCYTVKARDEGRGKRLMTERRNQLYGNEYGKRKTEDEPIK
jgi:hypothetical protein